jgi:hypothetical protein
MVRPMYGRHALRHSSICVSELSSCKAKFIIQKMAGAIMLKSRTSMVLILAATL